MAVGVGIGVGEGKGVGVGNAVGEGEGEMPVGVGLTDAVGEGLTVTIRRGEIWQPDKNTAASRAALPSRTFLFGPLSECETRIPKRMRGRDEALAEGGFRGRRWRSQEFQ
jgi:hypothetical protein